GRCGPHASLILTPRRGKASVPIGLASVGWRRLSTISSKTRIFRFSRPYWNLQPKHPFRAVGRRGGPLSDGDSVVSCHFGVQGSLRGRVFCTSNYGEVRTIPAVFGRLLEHSFVIGDLSGKEICRANRHAHPPGYSSRARVSTPTA